VARKKKKETKEIDGKEGPSIESIVEIKKKRIKKGSFLHYRRGRFL
jgi:hypothetical protein